MGRDEKLVGSRISIHALLAESDREPTAFRTPHQRFLSTLSLRRATMSVVFLLLAVGVFLSTLSLRRATPRACRASSPRRYFYPRSPCGERLTALKTIKALFDTISIHALLAESDKEVEKLSRVTVISIHALLAESDATNRYLCIPDNYFYPRSPCGERLPY